MLSPGSHCHTHKQVRNALSLYSGNQTDRLLVMLMVVMVMVMMVMVMMVVVVVMVVMVMRDLFQHCTLLLSPHYIYTILPVTL